MMSSWLLSLFKSTAKAASSVFEDLSLPMRALRDMMHEEVERVRIDSKRETEKAREFAQRFVPDWLDRIEEYSAERPIFDLFGVEDEIEHLKDGQWEE